MKKPRIAYIDIETALFPVLVFSLGKQVINHKQIMPGYGPGIICACWKWQGKKRIHAVNWGDKQDSAHVVEVLDREVFSKADIVIAHNGDKFDMRQINTHRLKNKLPPLEFPNTEDTLKQCRKHLYLPSYSLDYIAGFLKQDHKIETNFELWVDVVLKQKKSALKRMVKYCKKDVKLLEEVEQIIAPYVDHKLHRGVISGAGRDSCPNCSSLDKIKNGYRYSKVGKYQRFQCRECGHTWHDTRQVKE